jgi:hypothetical protein
VRKSRPDLNVEVPVGYALDGSRRTVLPVRSWKRSSGRNRPRCRLDDCEVGPANEHKARTEYFKHIKKDARATFEQPHQDGHGRPLLHGHRLPPPEQIVMEMNRLVSQPLADELVQGTYGLLSNFVHPTFYALQELFTVGGEAEDRTPALNRDINFHERLAGLVVAPFYQALGYVASYHGWTSQRFEELNRDIVRGLPNLFVAGPSPGPFGG